MNDYKLLYNESEILNLYYNNNILTLELHGKITDNIFNKYIETLDIFHKECENNNKKIHSVIDASNFMINNFANYLYYAPLLINFLNSQKKFSDNYLLGTIIIIDSDIVKKTLNSLFQHINSNKPIRFISCKQEIDILFNE